MVDTSKLNKVFISGDAIPSDTIVKGEELENNCVRQDICTSEKLRSTVIESKDEAEEDVYT